MLCTHLNHFHLLPLSLLSDIAHLKSLTMCSTIHLYGRAFSLLLNKNKTAQAMQPPLGLQV
jgi:hypothetical protein